MVIKDDTNMSKKVQNDVETVKNSSTENETPRKRGRPRKPVDEVSKVGLISLNTTRYYRHWWT